MTAPPPSTGGAPAPRHVTGPGPAGRRRWPVVAAASALVVAGVVVAGAALRGGDAGSAAQDECPEGRPVLEVAAAPEVAHVLASATGDGPERLLAARAACLDVRVTARLPGEVAASLTSGPPAFDAWVADSSSWLARLSPAAEPVSVATSPVVLAVARSTAEALGWPGRRLDLAASLAGEGPRPQRLGLTGLEVSGAARLGLVSVQRTLATRPDGRTELARALRSSDTSLPTGPTAALDRVAADPGLAVPVPEQAVWAHAGRAGTAAVVAAYAADTTVLDYPLVPLASSRSADLAALTRAVTGDRWRERVLAAGFRAADGGAGPGLTAERGVDGTAATSAPVADAADVDAAVRVHALATRPVRMLAVLDVSGSMAQPVPGLPGTRMDLATAAAGRGLGLLGDDAELGLWVFSTDLTPTTDHRELVPIGPLSTRSGGSTGREALATALADVRYVPSGDTGLYDTVLAAVRAVREQWDPEKVNSVILLTDGRNDDADGIALEELLTTLQREQGERPVLVNTIAYGPDTDVAALRRIGASTGGTVYVSHDPRRINEVLQDALGRRGCGDGC